VQKAKTHCLAGTISTLAGQTMEKNTTDKLTLDQVYALKGDDGTTWGQVIDAQKLGEHLGTAGSGARYEVDFPVLQYRGLLDEVIPAKTEEATRAAYCDARISTRWNTYAGDHVTTDQQAVQDTVSWLGDRFAGKAEPGNC
jgi:hypothetical protein